MTTIKTPVSPKVIAAALVPLVVPAILAMLAYLQTNDGQSLLGSLPVLAVIGINALGTTIAAALSGWLVKDRLRIAGAKAEATATTPESALAYVISNTPAADRTEEEIETDYVPRRVLIDPEQVPHDPAYNPKRKLVVPEQD